MMEIMFKVPSESNLEAVVAETNAAENSATKVPEKQGFVESKPSDEAAVNGNRIEVIVIYELCNVDKYTQAEGNLEKPQPKPRRPRHVATRSEKFSEDPEKIEVLSWDEISDEEMSQISEGSESLFSFKKLRNFYQRVKCQLRRFSCVRKTEDIIRL